MRRRSRRFAATRLFVARAYGDDDQEIRGTKLFEVGAFEFLSAFA